MNKGFGLLIIALMLLGCNPTAQDPGAQADKLVKEASLLRRQGRVDAAISRLNEAVSKNPTRMEAYSLLGEIYLAQNNIKQAEKNYLKAVQIRPDNAELRNNMGILYTKKGDMQQAVDNFTLAIASDPTLVAAYSNLADMALAGGKMETAVGLYQKALSIEPDYAPAKVKLEQILGLIQQATSPTEPAEKEKKKD